MTTCFDKQSPCRHQHLPSTAWPCAGCVNGDGYPNDPNLYETAEAAPLPENPKGQPETDDWVYHTPSRDGQAPEGYADGIGSWEVELDWINGPEGWRKTDCPLWKTDFNYRFRVMAAGGPELPENPKAIYGRAKPDLSLIPGGAAIPISKVFQLGAEKYGPFNWRKDPVEAATYMAAAQRHLLSWFDGEDQDEESGSSHLAHAACCAMILLDAMACGKLVDNRPHKGTSADLIRALTKPVENPA